MKPTIQDILEAVAEHFNLSVDKVNQHVIAMDFVCLLCYLHTGLKPYDIYTELGINSNTLYKFRVRAIYRMEYDGMIPVFNRLNDILRNKDIENQAIAK